MSAQDGINKLLRKLSAIRDEVAGKGAMLDVGKEAARLIKKRTRLGFGVTGHNAKKAKLDKLSAPYTAARKRKKPPGPSSPSKSNLTYTGKMLDDLEARNAKAGNAEIGFKSPKSEEKAKWVSEDRPFNFISKSEFKQLRKFIQETLNKTTKK